MKKKHIQRKKERKKIMRDSWDLNISFCEWIVPRLQNLHDNVNGFPSHIDLDCPHYGGQAKLFVEENDLITYFTSSDCDKLEVWKAILKDMINGFKEYQQYGIGMDIDKYKETKKSLQLFKVMFQDLWD